MELSTDPKKGNLELPADLISLTDLMDELVKQFREKPLGMAERQYLRINYTAAAEKYNELAGKKIMLLNINSVIASMDYASKKGDTLK